MELVIQRDRLDSSTEEEEEEEGEEESDSQRADGRELLVLNICL